jgi:hypothetical protein
MPAPARPSAAVSVVELKVKAAAPGLKVRPPRLALADKATPGTPDAAKKAVPVGTAVLGNQLLAALKLLVTPFHVAFWARAPAASPSAQSNAEQMLKAELLMALSPAPDDATT